ncbi:MAG: hypothetical protein DYG94_02585 [Leptolyngbya sp. PLA3]|nr:MAG: hypothetical protein EDM82_01970 [Cyanobacteria bacterium CYA]MCE7967614.1 hypothetical protein [Leptolyngbya sp. PL-A3]
MFVEDGNPGHGLSEADAQALDALIEAGFDAEAVEPVLRERARKVAQILGLLDCPIESRDTDLVAGTINLLRQRAHAAPAPEPVLSSADADALDSWIMSYGDLSRVPSAVRERAGVHEALRMLVTQTPVPGGSSREDLIERTLARLDGAIEEQAGRMRLGPRRGLRLADIISVAAVLLLGASVMLPVLSSLRSEARRSLCAANLGRVAEAMGIYAGSNNSALPMATAGFGGGSWIDVGSRPERSNSANLYMLVRGQYARLADLACPGNPTAPTREVGNAHDWRRIEEVSYSYQVQDGRPERLWGLEASRPIIADRSPVVLQIVRRDPIVPESRSPNHGSSGQHVLRTDGSTTWIKSPVLESGDNIWLPRAVEEAVAKIRQYYGMNGNEVPAGVDDVLLGP